MRAEVLEPRRVRYPRGGYGWVDLRIVTEGHLRGLGSEAGLVYLFLCTVGNRAGISFWSRARIAQELNLTPEEIDAALVTLTAADLIAAKDRVVQVLSVPDACRPDLVAQEGTQRAAEVRSVGKVQVHPSATAQPVSDLVEPEVCEDEIRAQEANARAQMARFLGPREPSASVLRGVARGLALAARRAATTGTGRSSRGDARD